MAHLDGPERRLPLHALHESPGQAEVVPRHAPHHLHRVREQAAPQPLQAAVQRVTRKNLHLKASTREAESRQGEVGHGRQGESEGRMDGSVHGRLSSRRWWGAGMR